MSPLLLKRPRLLAAGEFLKFFTRFTELRGASFANEFADSRLMALAVRERLAHIGN
jgi:hypothetical protein